MNPNNKRDEDRMCLFEEALNNMEKNRRYRGKYFFDGDYICCSTYGKPRSKDFHWKQKMF